MRWLPDWEFCRKLDCLDRKLISIPRNRLFAVQWLRQFQKDVFGMLAMRAFLSQEHREWQLSSMSDEAIIDQIAELLISDRLHVHAEPVQIVSARGSAGSEAPKFVPFPLSERKARAPAVADRAPVVDPSTFPWDLDVAAQGAALVAAAAAGSPFCPE